jgi:ferredoxin
MLESFMPYIVKLDSWKCIGCLQCTRCDNFEMGRYGKAYHIKTEVDVLGCIEEAAESCPVAAISVKEK